MNAPRTYLSVAILLLLAGCTVADAPEPDEPASAAFPCADDNGGLTLPEGLCAVVFAEDLGRSRHLVVDAEGDVYVQRNRSGRRDSDGEVQITDPGGVIALRDSDGDGVADVRETVNETPGTGVGIQDGYLYYTSDFEVFRVALEPGTLAPSGEPESVVSGFPSQAQHAAKTIAFDEQGNLYVNVGAPSNACQEPMRTPEAPGLDPCPQLERQAGIWRFSADHAGQTQEADGQRYATGIRNAVAIDWSPAAGELFVLQHGRDQLSQLWPELYDNEDNAELPSEELLRVTEGADFGWPYCYHDRFEGRKVLAPEYGGDGTTEGRCADLEEPVMAFPAHWAPNALLFYEGDALGERYAGGAFVAFHGSWNRMPLPQAGYNVTFVPFADGTPSGEYEVLIEGFPQTETVRQPGDATYRPTGLAQGPDGSLYISDDRQGRIWRVRAVEAMEPAAGGE